ncbi:hypothetical protein KDI_32400 [Dictyobacter arantiisoli]|uniref:Guanylate cyclase domain-containing protein n=1 Tax=Dictyobacter arantiisoli TaxID=2014874 RepID=A0A5A5TEV2_9CHLR|nr:hypothetical protein KDI_32400 [Dictyobacter arantiisoli]
MVTVMFADITGSTPLADRLDPEDMRAILAGYFNLMTAQIRKHDGTVEKYIGDAVMAVFGSPITHEDDPGRAIRAALDMQAALTLFNEQRLVRDPEATRLQMRIGINTGEVATPGITATRYQDFLITGDAVNMAARLQQTAMPDTILVGERTYLSSRAVFDFQAVAPLHVKGKTEPLTAYVVLKLCEPTGIIEQHPRGLISRASRLVGRGLELTLLHASYARVQTERHPHLITILGTPGIGKTRLVREFITREQELVKSTSPIGELVPPLILKGRCPPYGEGITYWPLIEILRSMLHVQEDDTDESIQLRFIDFLRTTFTAAQRSEVPEEIAETLLRHIGQGLIGKKRREDESGYERPGKVATQTPTKGTQSKQNCAPIALLRAWRILLEALAERQPLIIIIDDLQWADEALLDLFEYLTDRVTAVPILILCPARPDFLEHRRDWGSGQRNFTMIELDALTSEESNDLIDALLNTNELPENLRYTIMARSEGNPFFVEEIVRMFIDQKILIRGESSERGQDCWMVNYPKYTYPGEFSQPLQLVNDELHSEEPLNSPYLLPLPYVPDTIQGVLAARVDLLNPTDKLILQHCAIIGRTFWLSALLELGASTNADTIINALVSLMHHDFITEITTKMVSPITSDRTFIFKHILTRDVVYNNIPRQRRSREHTQMALWLEDHTTTKQASFVELIAHHFQRALTTWSPNATIDTLEIIKQKYPTTQSIRLTRADLRAQAINYLTITGDQAMDCYYALRALQAYTDAMEFLDESQADAYTRSQMLYKIGEAHAQRGNLDSAWLQFRRALQLVLPATPQTDKFYLLKIYNQLSLLATRSLALFDSPPDPQEIQSYVNAGLALLEDMPASREHVSFLTYLVFWFITQLDEAPVEQKNMLAEQGLQKGEQALRMAEELGDPIILSLTLDAMGFIYAQYYRRYRKAREILNRRLQLEHLITNREELYDLYITLGGTYQTIAEYATALTYYGKAWSNALAMESPPMVLSSMVGRMNTWYRWNRWDEAQQVAHEILQFIEKYQQDEKRQLWALETLATIAYHRGQQEEGDKYTRQYKRLTDQNSERISNDNLPCMGTKIHAIHLAQEDWPRALEDYRYKVQKSEPFPDPAILVTLVELLIINEETEQQEDLFDRAVTLCENAGSNKSLAVALRARGRLALQKQQWEQAEADLRRSNHYCEKLDLPWERAHTLHYLGLFYKCRADTRDTDEARELRKSDLDLTCYYLEQALGFYESLSATPSAQRVRKELAAVNALDKKNIIG